MAVGGWMRLCISVAIYTSMAAIQVTKTHKQFAKLLCYHVHGEIKIIKANHTQTQSHTHAHKL